MPIDATQTAQRVREFLNQELVNNLQMADLQFSDMKHPDEAKMCATEPGKIVYTTTVAMKHCSEVHRKILKRRYVDRISDQSIMQRLGCSRRNYMYTKKDALNEFANRYQAVTKNADMKPIDLRIYAHGLHIK